MTKVVIFGHWVWLCTFCKCQTDRKPILKSTYRLNERISNCRPIHLSDCAASHRFTVITVWLFRQEWRNASDWVNSVFRIPNGKMSVIMPRNSFRECWTLIHPSDWPSIKWWKMFGLLYVVRFEIWMLPGAHIRSSIFCFICICSNIRLFRKHHCTRTVSYAKVKKFGQKSKRKWQDRWPQCVSTMIRFVLQSIWISFACHHEIDRSFWNCLTFD